MLLKTISSKLFKEITFLGGILFYLFFSLVCLKFLGLNLFLKLILSLILIYFLTFLIRIFYFKQRPRRIFYESFLEKINASSFPSVHAARITFISLFSIIIFQPNIYYIFLILFLWILTLYSRIYLKRHYFFDIIGGVILGSLSLITLLIK